jgi:hypothetical protein
MSAPESLPDGALAYTRVLDTVHVLYSAEGIEALLYWAESESGEMATTSLGRTGEAYDFAPAWWVILQEEPTVRHRRDGIPAWDAEADDAKREAIIHAARTSAAALVATHRHRDPGDWVEGHLVEGHLAAQREAAPWQ